MNIVIPMAGEGSRFKEAGYDTPKPFIDVAGKTMIERVLQNLELEGGRFILIARSSHLEAQKEQVADLSDRYDCTFLTVDHLTMGAACTILLASWLINNDEPLLLANSDQIVEAPLNDYIADAKARDLDGSILTFYSDHTKWSYAKTNEQGLVTRVAEKVVISQDATVGLYYFSKGSHFVNAAAQMIAMNDRVNNEFYTAPAYNYCVAHGLKIGVYRIEEKQMFGTGTPEDLEIYLRHIQPQGA
ncbi:MAG: glycosyltransferase family 2 protein [Desulfarculaceae bacterium]|nr:glycosyltransferase family 2 protein [Desulfarculaceae bacterium]